MFKLAHPATIHDRRAAPREPNSEEVWLFDAGVLIGRARMVERSMGGMKLRGVPALIGKADKLLVPSTGRAFEIEMAWSVGFDAGLRVRRARRLWGAFAEPDFEPLRAAWLAPTPFA